MPSTQSPTRRLSCPLPAEMASLLAQADDLHSNAIETDMDLRQFLAPVLSYMPGWMRQLYRVRKYFVRLLGDRQESIPERESMTPQQVPFTPGAAASFFTVMAAREGDYWLAQAEDDMIAGYLGVIAEPAGRGPARLHFLSGARFLRPTGRIYYAIIMPFHHLVMRAMQRHAQRCHALRETRPPD